MTGVVSWVMVVPPDLTAPFGGCKNSYCPRDKLRSFHITSQRWHFQTRHRKFFWHSRDREGNRLAQVDVNENGQLSYSCCLVPDVQASTYSNNNPRGIRV